MTVADNKPYTTQLQAGLGLVNETKSLLEVAQTGIPGRGPDLSAPLFTVLAALLAAAVLADGRGDG